MLSLDDPRWQTYKGGYLVLYDASQPLRQLLETGATPELWDELWSELHHQGDLEAASYAAVPWLVEFVRRAPKIDWNPLAIIALIELERPSNPEVPADLEEAYWAAIKSLPALLSDHADQDWDELVLRSAIACIALAHGQRWYARAYFEIDRDTTGHWFVEEFGWEPGDIDPA